MAKRTRWQPPYPDPAKAYHVHQNAKKVSAALEGTLRRHIRCVVIGCTSPADERAVSGGVNVCLRHLQQVTAEFPDTLICPTCASIAANEERARARSSEPKKAPGVATIYYVQVGEQIKIGWTTNLHQRMRAYPPTARLLATERGTKTLERSRHQQFNEYLAHGREWFEPGKFLLEHIDRLIEKNGAPPQIETLRSSEKQTIPHRMKQSVRGSYKSTASHDGSAAVKRPAA